MIPLDTVVTIEYTSEPDPVTHFNGYNTASISADLRLRPRGGAR